MAVKKSNIVYYDGNEFPFPDSYFDCLVSKAAIIKDFTITEGNVLSGNGKILNQEHTLKRITEIYRVLKTNALVYIILHPLSLFHKMETLLSEEVRTQKKLRYGTRS